MSYPLQYIDIIAFQTDLLEWYDQNKRILPWRDTQDPYKIWVSEIMLQQTQVKTVIPYFQNFMQQFPTVFDLAEADEQNVLKAWEGLGYYSRARNLQAAARDVVSRFDGIIPDNPKELGSLKGIGPYTRGAILSIAFNQPEPAVDGNVMRVMSRIFKLDDNVALPAAKKKFEKIARNLIPVRRPASFNQGLMELGALVCLPKNPHCSQCPVQQHCQAYQAGQVDSLPVKINPKQKKVESYAAILVKTNLDQVVIEQRGAGLLANLWQFPMISVAQNDKTKIKAQLSDQHGIETDELFYAGDLTHEFTHKKWYLSVYTVIGPDLTNMNPELKVVDQTQLDHYPFPVPHQKMMPYLDLPES